MKKIISSVILIFLLLFPGEIFAQNKFHIELNGGYVLQGPGRGIFDAGKDAWTIGLNTSYSIFRDIRINLQTGYYNFPNYNIYSSGIAAPAQSDFVLPQGAYNFSTVEEKSARVYQLSLGISFINHYNSEFYPFVSVNSGFYFFNYINYGLYSYWLDGNNVVLPPRTESISLRKGFASIGIGFLIPVANKFTLNIQGIYSLTFDQSYMVQNFIPVLVGLEYSL